MSGQKRVTFSAIYGLKTIYLPCTLSQNTAGKHAPTNKGVHQERRLWILKRHDPTEERSEGDGGNGER